MSGSAAFATPYASYRIRGVRYAHIYVSPHMDDAIYSCGGQIALARAEGTAVLVITLFGDGGTGGAGVFGDSAQRQREERAAMDRLDLDHVWLDYPDLLARRTRLAELARYALPHLPLAPSALHDQIYAALEALCARLLAPRGHVYFPLAVGSHPDHRLTFEVGRALQASSALPVTFYEDVPYAHVDALRDERLHQLGLAPRGRVQPLAAATRAIHAFAFARAARWQQRLGAPAVYAHLALTRAFRRLAAPAPAEGELIERDIGAVIERKVAAMRDYETQTDFFFPAGDAIYTRLARAHGRYIERFWRLASAPRALLPAISGAAYASRERAKVDALLRQLPNLR